MCPCRGWNRTEDINGVISDFKPDRGTTGSCLSRGRESKFYKYYQVRAGIKADERLGWALSLRTANTAVPPGFPSFDAGH